MASLLEIGTKVEVASKSDGYLGSYYSAWIVLKLSDGCFVVKYKNLLNEDLTGRLEETVDADEVRPIPRKKQKKRYKTNEYVDAYDLDGWWVGRIFGKVGSGHYSVYFDISRVLVVYPEEKLRVHEEWSHGEWKEVDKSSVPLPSRMCPV